MTLTHHSLLSKEHPGTLRFGGTRIALFDIEAGFWGLRRQMEALIGRHLTDAVLQQAGTNSGVSFVRAFIGATAADGAQALRDCLAAYQAAGFGQFEIVALEWPIGRALIRGTDSFEAWMMRQHEQMAEAPACAYTTGVLVGFANALGGRQDIVCLKRTCQAQGAEACLFELLPADRAVDTPVIAFDPDPFLSHQLNLLELLFDRMPMGIAIFDQDFVLRRYNPTWAGFVDRYTPSSASQVVPGVHLFDLVPGIGAIIAPILKRVLAGETVHQEAFRLESGGIVSYWDMVWNPLIEDGKVVGALDVTTDVTERKQAEEALQKAHDELEQRVEERTREIERRRQVAESLRDILAILNSNRPLDEILDYIVVQISWLLDTDASAVYHLQNEERVLNIQAARGLDPGDIAGMTLPVGLGPIGQAVLKRQPIIVPNLSDHLANFPEAALEPQQQAFLTRMVSRYGAMLAVPLIVKGEVYGTISLYYHEPRDFSDEEIGLAVAFADQAALAIENARLRAQAEQSAVAGERSRLARDLHDAVTQTLFSASLIAEVLPRLWDRNQNEAKRRLEELRQLTRGALAEMRTLLLELRPADLTEAQLGELLRHLAEAITGRARTPVTLKVEGDCTLPPDVQVALYRITQEALNNVAKHAKASRAVVTLQCQPEQVVLHIEDDGRGFELGNVSVEHLGLGIMRERAESIGAILKLQSRPGQGTHIEVLWPVPQ